MVWKNVLNNNANKYHFLARSTEKVNLNADNTNIENSKFEKRLNVRFEHRPTFHEYVSDLCKKPSRKTYLLTRVTRFMSIPKQRILMNSFLKRSSIIARSYGCDTFEKIIEKWFVSTDYALRVLYNDKQLSFSELLSLFTKEVFRY